MLHLVWVKLVSQTFLKLLVLYLQIHMLSKKSPDLVSAKFPQLFGFAVCNSEWLKSWCGISMDILNLIYQNIPILVASREIFSILLWQNRQFFRRRLSQHQSQGEVVIGLAMDRWKKQDLHISNVWSESKSMESMDPLSLNMFWFSIDLCCQVETKVVDIIFAYICLIFTSYYWWKKSCTRQGEGSSFYVFYMFLYVFVGIPRGRGFLASAVPNFCRKFPQLTGGIWSEMKPEQALGYVTNHKLVGNQRARSVCRRICVRFWPVLC